MGIPIIGLIPKILKTAASVLGLDSVTEVVKAIQEGKLTPEQLAALKMAEMEYQKEMRGFDLDELRAMMSESLAMIQSEDNYVRRARPTGLYIFYACTVALVIASIFGVKVDQTVILALLGPLAGVGGTYVYRRSTEKLNGSGGE